MPADVTEKDAKARFKNVTGTEIPTRKNLPEIAYRDKITLNLFAPLLFSDYFYYSFHQKVYGWIKKRSETI